MGALQTTSQNQKPQERRATFSDKIKTETYQGLISQTIPDEKRRNRFLSGILSAVAVNPGLRECEPGTVLAGAFLGESLGLSPSPQLGQYYLIPFENKKKDAAGNIIYKRDADGNYLKEVWTSDGQQHNIAETEKQAVFVLGYKGYLQMSTRSGAYKKIIVTPIKKGELVRYNRITEEIILNPIDDDIKWEATETVGYYAKIELMSGFVKEFYWSREKMQIHADKHSKAYSMQGEKQLKSGKLSKKEMEKYSSFWYKDFDGMAMKTMIRQIISKWGVMSQDLSDSYERDNAILSMGDNGVIEIAEIMPGLEEDIIPEPEPEIAEIVEPAESVEPAEKSAAESGEDISFDDL